MYKINPYRAGAGLMPAYLAGRDQEIDDAKKMFYAISMNVPMQSVVYSGLRGVGKTVLMNALEKEAKKYNIFCRYIEVDNKKNFLSELISCFQTFTREASLSGKANHIISKVLDALKSLSLSFNPTDNTFELSLQEKELYLSGSLTQSLTETVVSVGELAQEVGKPICIFIDEMQYLKPEELSSLIAALHRANQLGYPVIIIGAGLPKIYKMLADEKSYAERLFRYQEIGSLSEEQSRMAIVEPAKKFKIEYADEAIKYIIDVTKGYPFFVQQFCNIIYDNNNGTLITKSDVEKSLKHFYTELDKGFFKSRYERCSELDKRFVFAMVKCGVLPCTIGNVAKNLKKDTSSVSPTRAKLIDKGLIYPVRHKELDFTVPEFDDFIKRLEEYQQWLKDTE